MDQRRGCLSGLLEMFLLDKLFGWLQNSFGFKRGGCMGCGCGLIMLVVFVVLAFSILGGTNWFRLGF